ncbi:MAG: threonine/serine dehydratase [Gammaproteobacteria bacterium]|nr:threonine/serine dehydratase [Gammaproteobacteria bacterium]
MIGPVSAPGLGAIRSAAERIHGVAIRTPLLRLNAEQAPAEIWIKCENLQPIGSFKVRPAASAILNVPADQLARGVYTASAGNMAQGVAYTARRLNVPCSVVLPRDAAAAKVSALQRLGARILFVSHEEWWDVLKNRGHPDCAGRFIHPAADTDVIAGDGTVGLEIFSDLPDLDTVVVPYGGGGLSCGIAAALRGLGSVARVFAAEGAHCAPLSASLAAGHPVEVALAPSFITGLGAGRVLEEMWPLAHSLLGGALVATEEETAAAVRLLFERHRLVVEGAGAVSVACALAGRAGSGRVVCVISGGNIDADRFARIIGGAGQ